MTNTIISIYEKEFEVKSIHSGMTWVVILDASVEVSEFRGEVDIELITYENIRFLPKSKYYDDDYDQFTCRFTEFKSLYHMFRKEDVDLIKESVEEEALDRLAND